MNVYMRATELVQVACIRQIIMFSNGATCMSCKDFLVVMITTPMGNMLGQSKRPECDRNENTKILDPDTHPCSILHDQVDSGLILKCSILKETRQREQNNESLRNQRRPAS